ncbi:uroporphyrinogen decarboxylase [Fodinisporobacter ferrooxydans]|uniref:Uroporphyrinogen decarboxylase n=1 Tax=Fodinisporobacter ferrooxydans TaxID=2901836 RepID=A0ABY4CMN7_9BACL|nr:uroporphyrinogen decarboxylase [Alicyclobacillaceae bacterium MYW30-H2]
MKNDRFLRACRREPVDVTPVWFMRQAGRSQAEYREIRKQYTLIEITHNPELCAEVTILPVKQYDVDAAILFSDIMVPIAPIGLPFDIRAGGPVIETPIRSKADVDKLHDFDMEQDLPYVIQTIQILSKELHVPLIGFSGAPFTLASYMIEGGPSRNHLKTKTMMYEHPDIWFALMDRLEKTIITYLEGQVNAGADALQIFDSWVGALSPFDYETYVLPTMKRIIQGISHLAVPNIHFGVGTGELLPLMKQAGSDVLGVDWRVPLADARKRAGHDVALQGNLDPATLLGPWQEIERRTRVIIDQGIQQPGFIFNLGHGVYPETNGEILRKLAHFVHEYSSNKVRQ